MAIVTSVKDWEQFKRLEESLLRQGTRFDRDHLERVLADDFFEFGKSGRVYQRGDIISTPSQPLEAVILLPNFSMRLLSEDVALVTYDSEIRINDGVERARRGSIFQTASISKSVTAWGVMRLVEAGKIDLDAPVEDYLTRWHLLPSGFDLNGVTVLRLLSHTSGIAAWNNPGTP